MAETQLPALYHRGLYVLHRFRSLEDALQQNPESIPAAKVLEIEETSERFVFWSSSIGLFNPAHSSLDYRLRDNKDIRSFTHRLLDTLDETVLKSQIFLYQGMEVGCANLCAKISRRYCIWDTGAV
jgi:hypothetical protein